MKSSFRILLSVLSAGLIVPALLSLGACSDVLTYSQDSKKDGIRLYNDGQFAQAAGSFRNAIRQDPTDPESEYWLGLSYEQTSSYHEAIDSYKTALLLMPDTSSIHYDAKMRDNAFDRLAHVIAQADVNNTETDLIAKTALKERSAEQYQLLARISRYRGDADTSLNDYRTSVRLDPENFPTQKELGLYLVQLGQNQEAGQVLRVAYRLRQNDKEVDAGLRSLGMVPGPGLLPQDEMAQPIMPRNSLPDMSAPAAHTAGPVDSVGVQRE